MRLTERVLSALVGIYPPAFRRVHGHEMRQFVRASFSDGAGDRRRLLLALDIVRGA